MAKMFHWFVVTEDPDDSQLKTLIKAALYFKRYGKFNSIEVTDKRYCACPILFFADSIGTKQQI